MPRSDRKLPPSRLPLLRLAFSFDSHQQLSAAAIKIPPPITPHPQTPLISTLVNALHVSRPPEIHSGPFLLILPVATAYRNCDGPHQHSAASQGQTSSQSPIHIHLTTPQRLPDLPWRSPSRDSHVKHLREIVFWVELRSRVARGLLDSSFHFVREEGVVEGLSPVRWLLWCRRVPSSKAIMRIWVGRRTVFSHQG